MCQMFKLATHREVNKWWVSLIPSLKYSWNNRKFESHTSVYNQIFVLLGFRWPSAAKTLAGLLGDDQSASRFSGTMKSFPDLGLCICESMNKISFLGLFLYFPTCQNNFPTCQNNFPTCQNYFTYKWIQIKTCRNNFSTCQNNFPTKVSNAGSRTTF